MIPFVCARPCRGGEGEDADRGGTGVTGHYVAAWRFGEMEADCGDAIHITILGGVEFPGCTHLGQGNSSTQMPGRFIGQIPVPIEWGCGCGFVVSSGYTQLMSLYHRTQNVGAG